MPLEEKPKTAAEITPEQIEAWKKAHKNGVWKITVDDKSGYVRKPGREDMKYAMTKLKDGGELAMAEAMLEEMWLGGDVEVLEEDEYFFGACMKIQELIQVKNAELVKL